MAETEIQTAVDLLGRGATEPPPNVDDLMKPVVYESLGESITADQYEAALDKVETTQTALLTMDEKVMKTAIVVQAANDRTLRSIKTVVKDLNIKLAAVGSAKLKATQEVALMKAIAAAVEDVYEKVTAVADANADMAGDSSDSSDSDSDSSGSSSGSSDSGSGGLGQMLQSLASMVPMLAMAAAPVAQELLTQNKDKDKDQHTEGAQPQDAQAAPPGTAPAPGSPTPAPAPGATGQPAAAAPADPNASGSAAPAANSPLVPARANVRRSTTRPPGSTATGADTEEVENVDDEMDEPDSAVVQA
ncbi:hypothetical protein OG874_22420 [Nocardia sp. NBC_00565]|uniref:hypothetical protein n=1 Tax=Nocardia sp. NBC_00565 TaxID=2975993 RepID=UPI002E81B19D|nr:hypothetical protein [Nocardia sp. NBC_00565]WUC07674.1 hypothetical protein OG874_22420 [Nocardia sp. NBC_00565]